MDQQEDSDMEDSEEAEEEDDEDMEDEDEDEVHSPVAPWLLTIVLYDHLDESDSSEPEGIQSTRHARLARSPQSYLRQAGAFDYFKDPSDFCWFC